VNPDYSYKNFMTDMAALGVYVLVPASPDNDEYFGKYRYSTITKSLSCDGGGSGSTSASGSTCYPALLLEYGKNVRLSVCLSFFLPRWQCLSPTGRRADAVMS